MDALARHGGFTERELVEIPFEHHTDRAGILDFVASITFVGVLPDAERAALLERCSAALAGAGDDLVVARRRRGLAQPPAAVSASRRSSGSGETTSTRSPVTGWSNDSRAACRNCRSSP